MRIHFCVMVFLISLAVAGCGKGKPTDDLIQDLNSAGDASRLKAVRLLQDRKGEATKVVPALIKSLKDVEVDVRLSAAIGLGYFGTEAKSAIPALEELQRDSDARVRNAAKVAISRIR